MIESGPKSWIRPYYPSFDGIRGLAILLVFLCHFGVLVRRWLPFEESWVGVDLFFILSGFLITGILFDTIDEKHYFRNFYVRRTLRIFPLYYLAISFIVLLVLCTKSFFASRYFLAYAFYAGNIVEPFLNLDTHNPDVIGYWSSTGWHQASIGYFWSLCAEEQFYLVWPLIVYTLRKRERLMRVALAGAASSLILRSVLAFVLSVPKLEEGVLYRFTATRCDTLFIGAWCALWLRGIVLGRDSLRKTAYVSGGISLILLAIGLSATLGRWPSRFSNPFVNTIGYTLIATTAAAFLLLSLDDESIVSRFLRNKLLIRLGVVSYGFYIFHDFLQEPIVRVLARHRTLDSWRLPIVIVYFGFVYTLAMISYKYFETPFLRLKKKLAPSSHSGIPITTLESKIRVSAVPEAYQASEQV